MLAGGDPDADAAWQSMIGRPIGHAITEAVGDDLVRGVMATDAVIGTFAVGRIQRFALLPGDGSTCAQSAAPIPARRYVLRSPRTFKLAIDTNFVR